MKATQFVITILFISSCFGENPSEIEKPATDLNIIWQTETNSIDAPSAQPVIIGDSVLILTGELYLRALRTIDGVTKWRGEIDGEGSLDSKILLQDADKIVSAHWNSILAWDIITGKQVMKLDSENEVSVFGLGRNTVVDNGFAFIGDTLDAYILNKNGTKRFTIDVEFGSLALGYESHRVFLGQTKTINGALTKGKIRAFDSQSGDSLWIYETENGGFTETIITENGILYGSTFGNSPENEAVALNSETGVITWKYESDYIFTRNAALGPLHYYVNTGGSLAALDKKTGQLRWREEWLGTASTKPVYLEGYVYFTDYSEIKVIEDETGKVVHREPTPDGTAIWHIAASSDKIFAQTSRQLIAYQPWHLRED